MIANLVFWVSFPINNLEGEFAMKKNSSLGSIYVGLSVLLLLGIGGKSMAAVDVQKSTVSIKVPSISSSNGDIFGYEDHTHLQKAEDKFNSQLEIESFIIAHPGPTDENGCHLDERGIWHCH